MIFQRGPSENAHLFVNVVASSSPYSRIRLSRKAPSFLELHRFQRALAYQVDVFFVVQAFVVFFVGCQKNALKVLG